MAFMSQEEAIAKAEADAQAKRDAARRAVSGAGPATAARKVTVRVMHLGHDRISMGHHAAGFGDAYYEKGDRFDLGEDIATALEARGFVEIEGEVQPPIPQLATDTDAAKAAADAAKTPKA